MFTSYNHHQCKGSFESGLLDATVLVEKLDAYALFPEEGLRVQQNGTQGCIFIFPLNSRGRPSKCSRAICGIRFVGFRRHIVQPIAVISCQDKKQQANIILQ